METKQILLVIATLLYGIFTTLSLTSLIIIMILMEFNKMLIAILIIPLVVYFWYQTNKWDKWIKENGRN